MDLNKLLRTQWDRSAAVAAVVLGAIFLLVGWIGVSGTAYLAEQSPYIVSGGIGGVFLLGLGATLWISADLRDEWRKLDRIERALGDGNLRWQEDTATVPSTRTAAVGAPVAVLANEAHEADELSSSAKPAARTRKAATSRTTSTRSTSTRPARTAAAQRAAVSSDA